MRAVILKNREYGTVVLARLVQELVPEVLTFGSITLDNEAGGLNPGAAHPVWAVLAIELNIPLVDRLDQNPCEVIETGDWVKVDAEKGIVEVTKKK